MPDTTTELIFQLPLYKLIAASYQKVNMADESRTWLSKFGWLMMTVRGLVWLMPHLSVCLHKSVCVVLNIHRLLLFGVQTT